MSDANLESVVDAEILALEEELAGKGVGDFREKFHYALEKGHKHIIIDCKALKIMSSEGLEALLSAIEEAQETGGLVKIAALGATPRKVFEITQFDRIFELYDDVIAALKSL